jgi:aldehyde dehydrogenase (NAD+)
MVKVQEAPIFEKVEMKRDYYHLVINGERVESSNGATIDAYNPATGEILAKVAKATQEDAERAVQAARAAFESGKNSPLINALVF